MPATRPGSTGRTRTCRLPPTAPVPKTSASGPAATCTAPTSGSARLRTYGPDADAKFYLDAARDLYNAARRDVEAGREERAGELARAAEAMTHVPEHLSNAAGEARRPGDPRRVRPAAARPEEEAEPGRGGRDSSPPPDPKDERAGSRDRGLPPPLP